MKFGLRTKLLAILVISGVLPLVLALTIVETLGYRHLVSEQGARFQTEAAHVAHNLTVLIEQNIRTVGDFLVASNAPEILTYLETVSPPADRATTQALDARWPSLPTDGPEINPILRNPLSEKLRALKVVNPLFAEIMVTDDKGRLIAATGKTSDYDQSDESWWQKAMRLRAGEALVSGLDYDKSAGVFSLDLSLPVTDPRFPEKKIGVLKVVISASALFASVPLFSPEFDIVGEVADSNGRILVRLNDKHFQPDERNLPKQAIAHFGRKPAGWFLEQLSDGETSMVGFAPFHLLGVFTSENEISGNEFFVIVHNKAETILAPLRTRAIIVLICGLVLVLVCAGVGIYLSQRDILRPVGILRQAASALAAVAGHRESTGTVNPRAALEAVSTIQTGDEMETLAGDFKTMAARLLRYQEDLRREIAAKTDEIQRDLDMARDFQQAFLPKNYPQVPSSGEADALTLNFHHAYRAAMSVGGDFFDVIKLNDHCAGVLVADVMGHGTRSALVTAILRTLLHSLARTAEDPGFFLSLLNHHFHQTMRNADQVIFATACYIVLDTRNCVIRCASAGHPSPLLGNRRTGKVERLYGQLKENPALGLFAASSHEVFTRPLEKDDVLLLYTDGLIEAMNSQDEDFGEKRLEETMRQHLDSDITRLTQEVLGTVLKFAGPEALADDLCLVLVEAVANATPASPTNLPPGKALEL